MRLWNINLTHKQPYLRMRTPTRLFVEGAVKALEDAPTTHKTVILNDIATEINCDPESLWFLIHDGSADIENDIAVPDFRTRLMA